MFTQMFDMYKRTCDRTSNFLYSNSTGVNLLHVGGRQNCTLCIKLYNTFHTFLILVKGDNSSIMHNCKTCWNYFYFSCILEIFIEMILTHHYFIWTFLNVKKIDKENKRNLSRCFFLNQICKSKQYSGCYK